jgi:hypothetical protein
MRAGRSFEYVIAQCHISAVRLCTGNEGRCIDVSLSFARLLHFSRASRSDTPLYYSLTLLLPLPPFSFANNYFNITMQHYFFFLYPTTWPISTMPSLSLSLSVILSLSSYIYYILRFIFTPRRHCFRRCRFHIIIFDIIIFISFRAFSLFHY